MKILSKTNTNPRDPDVVFYQGKYYTLFSQDNCLWMKITTSLQDILTAKKQLVYVPSDDYVCSIWAPELHIINGVPYIYVTMAKEVRGTQHMFVLTNDSGLIAGPYKKIAYLRHEEDAWAIDGTLVRVGNELYYVYSAFGKYDEEMYQALYIVKMKNPYTFDGKPRLLTKSQYDWEKRGCDGGKRPYVTEGPYAVYHKGKTFIVYSASGCWTDYYCLGLLEYKGGDPLDENSWSKLDRPILDNDSGFVGPGHASFIQNDPSGTEYCSFHAYNTDSSNGEWDVSAYTYPLIWEDDLPKILIK